MGFVAACLLLVPAARADETDQATRLTFNQPVEIPGNKVLAAGTYLFAKIPDMGGARLVQIFNENHTKLYATLVVEPARRQNATHDTEVILAEPAQNQPKQLLTWFYPDRLDGHQFVYNRDEEKAISRETKLTVLASPYA